MNKLEEALERIKKAYEFLSLTDGATDDDYILIGDVQDLLLNASEYIRDMLPDQTQDKE